MVTATDATEALDEVLATQHLARLDPRLTCSPSTILGIPAYATAIDACVAFAALAQIYHPKRYRSLSPQVAARAQQVFGQLEQALAQYLAVLPMRPTRRITERGLPPPRPPGDAQS